MVCDAPFEVRVPSSAQYHSPTTGVLKVNSTLLTVASSSSRFLRERRPYAVRCAKWSCTFSGNAVDAADFATRSWAASSTEFASGFWSAATYTLQALRLGLMARAAEAGETA